MRSTTRASSAFSSERCCAGSSSSSTSSTSAPASLVGLLQLLELALADVRARIRRSRAAGRAPRPARRPRCARARGARRAPARRRPTAAARPARARVRARARWVVSLTRRHIGDCATLAPDARLSPTGSPRARSSSSNIPSESRQRGGDRRARPLARARLVRAGVRGRGRLLWARPRREGRPLVVLAGHYDTVPAQENVPGRIEDGTVVGLGASDMKGGLAVMLELARELDATGVEPAVDVALLAFGKEELPAGVQPAARTSSTARGVVHEAELAILLEPTDNTIQAGCLGNLNARIVFHGVSGHSARPVDGGERDREGARGAAAVSPRSSRGRSRSAGSTFTEVRERHRDRRRDRDERHPGPGRGERQLPLRAGSLARERGGVSPQPRRRGGELRACRRLAARPCRHRFAARAAAARAPATSRSSRSRRGRTSPTSRRAGSTPSTSGPARRGTRTGGTSRSRSRRSSGRSTSLWALRHG